MFSHATLRQVCLTLFALCCLVLFNFVVANDIQQVLVLPLERLVLMMRTFSENPLAKFKFRDEPEGVGPDDEIAEMIRCMKQLGNLVQVAFGEAGSQIVSQNLRRGSVFTMHPGKNVNAIFCFCEMRDFTYTTEVLRHDVPFFVNNVAEIVHSTVIECGGMPNKNIGDCFLCVWRMGDMIGDVKGAQLEKYRANVCLRHTRQQPSPHPTPTHPNPPPQAENALYFVLATRNRLAKSEHLQAICNKINGICQMGFGLHYGWAVEGAVGSAHKVDASYLSPHVNIALLIEGATRQYGVTTLMSAPFFCLLSRPVRDSYTKPVDVVSIRGSKCPVVLYTGEKNPGVTKEIEASLIPDDFVTIIHELQLFHESLDPVSYLLLDDTKSMPNASLFCQEHMAVMKGVKAKTSGGGDREILTRLKLHNEKEYDAMGKRFQFDVKTVCNKGRKRR